MTAPRSRRSAEACTAAVLLVSGAGALRGCAWSRPAALVGLGMLGYTASAGACSTGSRTFPPGPGSDLVMELPWWLPFGRVPEITPGELAERLRRRPWPQLLDVRTAAEFAGGHVRGAVNVPVTELRSRLASLRLDPGRPVVALCLTAHRSAPAVRLLRQRGFEALQLAGGMRAWRSERLPEARL